MGYKTSVSALRSYRTCSLKWYYSDENGLDLEPIHRGDSFAMGLGNIIHDAMYNYLSGNTDNMHTYSLLHTTDAGMKDKLSKLKYTIGSLQNYLDGLLKLNTIHSLEKKESVRIQNPLTNKEIIFNFIPDIVVKSKKNKYTVIDLKTTGIMPLYVDYLDIDEQALGYCALLNKKYPKLNITDFKFVFMNTRNEVLPKINNRGEVTKFKGTNVLAIKAAYESINQSAPNHIINQELKDNPEKFIKEVDLPVSKEQQDQFITDICTQVYSMTSPYSKPYPNPSKFCGKCSYFIPCSYRHNLTMHQRIINDQFVNRNKVFNELGINSKNLTSKEKRTIIRNYIEGK